MFVLPLVRSSTFARRNAIAPSFDRLVDRLFDESFDRPLEAAKTEAPTRTPALDVAETDASYTLSFDVPGATRDALKVSVEGRRVTLTTVPAEAAVAAPAADAGEPATSDARPVVRALYRERSAPVFARTVSLPAEVDQQASQAKFENGVLTLVLAKKVASGATQLQIA